MSRMLYSVASAAVLIFGLCSASTAQVANMEKAFKTFEVLNVAATLSEANVPFRMSQMEDGTPLFLANVGEGQTIVIAPVRCLRGAGSECYSLLYMSLGAESQLPFASLGENLVIVNYLNAMLDLAEAHINPVSGIPVVVSVLNSDYGVAKGNILATLDLQIQATNYTFGELLNAKASTNTLSSSDVKDTGADRQSQNRIYTGIKSVSGPSNRAQKRTPFQSMAKPGTDSSLLANPAFQALISTEDFQRDFSYRVESE